MRGHAGYKKNTVGIAGDVRGTKHKHIETAVIE